MRIQSLRSVLFSFENEAFCLLLVALALRFNFSRMLGLHVSDCTKHTL